LISFFFFQTKNKNMLLISLHRTVGTLPLRLKQGKHSRALDLPNSGIRHACFLAMSAKCRAFIYLLGTISSRWVEGTMTTMVSKLGIFIHRQVDTLFSCHKAHSAGCSPVYSWAVVGVIA
jgi:hypothetical protein